MKTKQEIIEEAYGDYWRLIKLYVDDDGWLCRQMVNDPEYDGSFHWIGPSPEELKLSLREVEREIGFKINKWRPVSLRGIEDNNGWHTINGPEDLPKVKGFYWTTVKHNIGSQPNLSWFSNSLIEEWLNNVIHWRPDFQPPLYGPNPK